MPVPAPIVPDRPRRTPPAAPKLLRAGGFTLVEVMMAALMLTVAFIGMIEAVTLSARMMDSARRQTLATQIINHEIEKLRFLPWTNGSTGINDLPTASTAITIDSQFAAATAASGATFTLARTVTAVNPVTNIREINFTVTWVVKTSRLDGSGNIVSFTYNRSNSAWFGKYGLNLSYQRS